MTDPHVRDGLRAASGRPGPSLDALVEPIRIRLDIAYDGTDFCGWAVQPGQRSVQADIEAALIRILRVPRARLVVAGRTDAGVHALGQVAHFDVERDAFPAEPATLIRRLAGVLEPDIRVRGVSVAPPGFDARFSANWRRYEYRVTDADYGADPLRRRDTMVWPRRLDAAIMQVAAQSLLGVHDFAAYCRHRDGATTVRGLQDLFVHRDGPLITVHARADAFCHSMVRSLVGAIIAVGEQRQKVEWPAQLLELRRRSSAVTVAPARGLTLMEVGYPPAADFAARAAITRNVRGPVDSARSDVDHVAPAGA